MMHIHCQDSSEIAPSMANALAELCKPDSEMQGHFLNLAIHQRAMPDMHIAVAYTLNDEGFEPWGWAATSMWDGKLCLQQFVKPERRGRYLATSLTAALFLDRGCPQSLCVFAPETAAIATRLGVTDVRYFKRVEDGWIRSEWSDARHEAGGDESR